MIKYKFYTFYIRINCDQIEVYFALCFQNILNITNFGDILFFPSNFLCSSRISFTFPSKFISFKFPSLCKNFLSKGNFLQSGSAARVARATQRWLWVRDWLDAGLHAFPLGLRQGKSLGTRLRQGLHHGLHQSRSPSLRSLGRKRRLWDNPLPEARNPG